MIHVLVGNGDEDYRQILACRGGDLQTWVVPRRAVPKDLAVMFVPGSGFVAKATIAAVPKKASFGRQHAYRSRLTEVSCLSVPVPLAHVEACIPRWGWLRQRMKSRHTPDAQVAKRLVACLDDYQSDFTPAAAGTSSFQEGTPRTYVAVRYERDPAARAACIRRHGSRCAVCGFEFGEAYGAVVEGFILVHHLEPISANRRSRVVNPARDMRPVCANCHVVMHRKKPPYSVVQVRKMLAKGRAG